MLMAIVAGVFMVVMVVMCMGYACSVRFFVAQSVEKSEGCLRGEVESGF